MCNYMLSPSFLCTPELEHVMRSGVVLRWYIHTGSVDRLNVSDTVDSCGHPGGNVVRPQLFRTSQVQTSQNITSTH